MNENGFDGLEIMGKLCAWTLNVKYPNKPMPTIKLEYRPTDKVVMGGEAARQLTKWQDIPLGKRGKYRLYARCRVDFHVIAVEDEGKA